MVNNQISIVIPTHNRCDSLKRTLIALNNQSIGSSNFEVIIVADGCIDNTVSMLKDFKVAFSLQIIEQSGLGAAVARNHGASIARGKIILFLDDDVVPCAELVAHHLKAHNDAPKRVVIGPYLPITKGVTSYLRMIIRSWWNDQFIEMSRPYHRFTFRDFMTGNISMEKSEFTKLNGFDETFKFIEKSKGACSCEDWELGVRAIKSGLQFFYCSGAYADHYEQESTDIKRFLIRASQEGRGETLMGERHPEIISLLQMSTHGAANLRTIIPLRLALLQSSFVDVLVNSVTALLPVLEYFRLRRSWRNISGWARLYWYWSGVTEKLSTYESIEEFLTNERLIKNTAVKRLAIDLMDDIGQIQSQIDKIRPDALIITYGELELGLIWPWPGAEKLRGIHTNKILENHLLNSAFSELLMPLGK